jgi:hypothetical protein
MTKLQRDGLVATPAKDHSSVTGSDRRTLNAIFRHPLSHNLGWSDVVALFETIGEVEERANNEFSFRVGGVHHLMHKPHTKDLTAPEVIELRHFLTRAGWQSGSATQPSAPRAADLLVVMDHHEAKIYELDPPSHETSQPAIKPYDPHHFLHHLVHKDQSREQGQRAPEDHGFYTQIADAVAAGGRIVVAGHGTGKSNAAHHFIEYLRARHGDTYRRVVHDFVVDLSSQTPAQLFDLARQALRP